MIYEKIALTAALVAMAGIFYNKFHVEVIDDSPGVVVQLFVVTTVLGGLVVAFAGAVLAIWD